MSMLVSKLKGTEGLSLIEVLIAVGAVLIGAMTAYALYANIHGSRVEGMAVIQAQQEAWTIVERIAQEVRVSSPPVVWMGSQNGSEYFAFFTPRNYIST